MSPKFLSAQTLASSKGPSPEKFGCAIVLAFLSAQRAEEQAAMLLITLSSKLVSERCKESALLRITVKSGDCQTSMRNVSQREARALLLERTAIEEAESQTTERDVRRAYPSSVVSMNGVQVVGVLSWEGKP